MIVERLPEHLRKDAVSLWREAALTRPWDDPWADLERALGSSSSTVLAVVEGGRLTGTRQFYERMGYAVQDTAVLGKFFDPERQAQQSG